jgi:outer membrane protein OmpA-like peptidoglycan-associated protein
LLAYRLLDPGRCRQGPGRLQVRQGSAAEGSLRAANAPKAAAVPAAKPTGDKITVAADALFDFDKATLRPEGKKKLDEVAAKSKEIKLEVILAVGHTDRFGSDAYNQKLSERRAAAVKTYLVSKGIDANRVYTEGKGKKNPVTKPDQCPGRRARRSSSACSLTVVSISNSSAPSNSGAMRQKTPLWRGFF